MVFVSNIEGAIRKCVPKKKVFNRNDKKKVTVLKCASIRKQSVFTTK